jgi:NhaP-type Na+/H+ and K+/H+ antiporter
MQPIDVVNYIILLISEFFRFAGMAVLGLGLGWLIVDLFRKITAWQGQISLFLGLAGLIIGLSVFTGIGAMGAFAIGLGVAIFLWGMPRKPKEEKKKSDK